MTYRALPCFKAYDVRGRIGIDLDGDVAYRVGSAVAQHFAAETVVVGYDARENREVLQAHVSAITDVLGRKRVSHIRSWGVMRRWMQL